MKKLLALLVVSCLALSEACLSGPSTLSGGGFNGHGWFQTPDGHKVVPTGLYRSGSSIGVAGYTVDTWKIFRMIDGVFTEYSVPGGLYNAQGVSDTGYIAGISNAVPTGSAFVMDPSGNFQTLGYDSAGLDVDASGALYGDYFPTGAQAERAIRRMPNGNIEELAPELFWSTASCAADQGQPVGIIATPTSTSTDSLPYAWMAPGQVVALPMKAGDTWGCPWDINSKGAVGEAGPSGINTFPTLWEFKQDGTITRETLPGIGAMVKGSATAISDDLSIIGGEVFNGTSSHAGVIWLKKLNGTRFAQDVKSLMLAAGFPVGTMFFGVGDVSADGRIWLINGQDKLISPTKVFGVVLDLFYGPPIGPVKKQSLGSPVSLSNKVVTAEYGDCFYIEDFDRSSGIRVVATSLSVKHGDRISLSGTLQEINGENFVSCLPADVVVFPGVYPSPKPLTINNRQVGGEGANGGTGLRNTGLLITSFGKVSFIDPSGRYFVINDGTDLENGTPHPGLTVSTENLPSGVVITPPAIGSFVCVTGISSVRAGNYPQIRPRAQSDVTPL